MHLDNEPVAGTLAFVQGDVLSVYLMGMDDRFAESRPGFLLSIALIRWACQNGVDTIDYLRGDEEYKKRLGAKPNAQYFWRCASNAPLARLRMTAREAGNAFKKWVKHQYSENR